MSNYRRLLAAVRPHASLFAAAVASMVILAGATGLFSWLVGPLFQYVFRGGELSAHALPWLPPLGRDEALAYWREVIAAMRTGGYILDGFPRTLAQAEQAYALAEPAGLAADAVVYLAVPDDEARRRLAGREADRTDDADPVVIERRLRLFHAETKPLLDYYARRAILVTIDAVQSAETVSAAIFAALADREFRSAGQADRRGKLA